MAYTSLPTVTAGEPTRASWGNLVDTNLDDHESRIATLEAGGGTGNVVGPASATDNAIPRYDGTTGELLQNSGITIPDGASGSVNGVNTGDVTLAGSPNYLTIAAQVITRALINLASHVTGRLPFANLTAATAANRLLGRGSSGGGGDFEEIVLGSGLQMTANVLDTVSGGGGGAGGAPTNASYLTLNTDGTLSNERVLTAGSGIAFTDAGAGATLTIDAIPQPGTNAQTTFLITGGQIAWQSAYTFLVSAAQYSIQGELYSSPETTVVLDAADATLDRIDIIVADTAGTVSDITGTAAAQPVEPDYDSGTQVKLGFIYVPAASTAPPTITNVPLYAENAGDPTEWDWTTSGSGWTLNSTNNPRSSTTDIEGTTVASGAYAQGEIGSGTIEPNDYSLLLIFIRSKATWANNRGLAISLRLNGGLVGQALNIQRSGTWGFDSSITGSYQLVAIPITAFAIPAGGEINQIRVTDFGGSIGFYLDDISLQGGGSTAQPPAGITQEQADARYTQRSNNLSDLTSASTARTNLAAAPNTPSFVTLGTNGELTSERVLTGSGRVSVTDAGAGSTVTLDVPNDGITYAKIQNVSAASRLLGRGSAGGSGDVEEVVLGSGLSMSGTTLSATGTGGDVVGPSSSVDAELALFDSTTGKLLKRATGTGFVCTASGVYSASKLKRVVGAILGEGSSVISTGVAGFVSCPVAGTITKVRLLSSDAAVTSGSIVVDIWKDTYANYPPTVADTITASAKPTISTATKSEDSTLTGWTTSVAAGDVFGFNVDSVTSLKRVTLELTIEE